MTSETTRMREIVLPEYIPDNLGAPFKVVLKHSVRQIVDEDTGIVEKTIIPNPRGLLQRIALTRLAVPRKLTGADIKFIRKSLKVKASELAGMIEVSPEHLSRCEAGDRILSPGVEKCLRMAILLDHFKLPEGAEDICDKSDKARDLFSQYMEIVGRLKSIMTGMTIPAAYDAREELSLSFFVAEGPHQASNDPDDEGKWTGEETALAA